MPRKKQLKVNGSEITKWTVEIKEVKSAHDDSLVKRIFLEIKTIDESYKYEIWNDERFRELEFIGNHIENALNRAKIEFLKVEISEYTERWYLFFEVQSIGQHQYSGIRT